MILKFHNKRHSYGPDKISYGHFGWAWSMWAVRPRIDRIVKRDVQYQFEFQDSMARTDGQKDERTAEINTISTRFSKSVEIEMDPLKEFFTNRVLIKVNHPNMQCVDLWINPGKTSTSVEAWPHFNALHLNPRDITGQFAVKAASSNTLMC
ncbi:hypothetical protein DPMN_058040 [Dreissena polymorpha]|uniref:Uncharacterized protein n=1 Tax=Dreissena polymorpha TaxID=45954 RepID=A0A9D4C1E9_DREPO|nr:hypothetical protein DPMN_058040 [Dreissena polymorpha]